MGGARWRRWVSWRRLGVLSIGFGLLLGRERGDDHGKEAGRYREIDLRLQRALGGSAVRVVGAPQREGRGAGTQCHLARIIGGVCLGSHVSH